MRAAGFYLVLGELVGAEMPTNAQCRDRFHMVSANSSRPISMRRISLVPAPIS